MPAITNVTCHLCDFRHPSVTHCFLPQSGSQMSPAMSIESVNNAIEHAKVAAYAITGRKEEYTGIPWFWSN